MKFKKENDSETAKTKSQKSLHRFVVAEKEVNRGTFYRTRPRLNPFQTGILRSNSMDPHFRFLDCLSQ